MGKIFLLFILVVICVHFEINGVYGKSSKLVNKHESEIGSKSKKNLNMNSGPKTSDTSAQVKNSINVNENKNRGLENLDENANDGKQIRPKIMHEGSITTEDYLKTLTSTEPIKVSKDSESNTKQSNSTAIKNIKIKSEINKSDNERNEISTQTQKVEDEKTEQKKSIIETPKETKENLSTRKSEDKISKSKVEKTSNSSKHETTRPGNSKKKDSQNINADKIDKDLTKSKNTVEHAKHKIHKPHNSEWKGQTKASVSHPHSKTKSQPLKTEQASLTKTENKTLDNGKTKKKAKKLLVSFFHSELDDEEHAHENKTHVVKENKHGKQSSRVELPTRGTQHAKKEHEKKMQILKENENGKQSSQVELSKSGTQHAKGEHEKKTHVMMESEHGEKSTQVDIPHIGAQHAEGKHEKKTHVMVENEHDEQSTQDDMPRTHTKDEESTLADISDKLYKRTGLQPQPQVTNQNNKVIEIALPSGPHAKDPQHIRLSNAPTHVLYKPVHKYYPAIHRYMTKPIHRYLKKPVDLSSLNPPLQGQEFTSTPQVKKFANAPVIQHNIGIPKVVANNLASVSGRLGDKGSAIEMKQYASPTGRDVQASIGQPIPGGLVNDQTPTLQARHYGTSPRIVPGGFAHDRHILPGGAAHVGPVRIFTQLPPRIQPVLMHPHRLSPTGFGPCSTNPCKNGAVCSTVNDQAMCVCKPDFRGKFCELANRCHPNPCHNYGACTEVERDFECSCKKGHRGKRCELENKCEPNPCLNGATCSESEDDYVCTCREGFLGHSCEAESKCNPINPCKNGATCREARDTYKCFCRDGFGGYNCEARIRRNICLPNPCQNGGFCTITGTSTGNYTCSCAAGWKGGNCVEKVDNWGHSAGPTICESINPCMYGGKCTPVSYYDYTCTCPQGRGGAHCEQIDHPKFVSSCSHCHAYARCLDGHCSCKEGYAGDGKNCEPVQQFCHPNPCYNGGTCRQSTNQKRSLSDGKPWWCECSTGYMGPHCQEMDLCLMRLCQNGGTCLSVKGQTKCLCPPTYRGKYCQEKNVCHGNPCKNGGLCKAVEGVAKCSCPEAYDGALCQYSKCSKCDRYASCVKGDCVCNDDYIGDGLTCRKKITSPPKVVPPTLPPASPPKSSPPPPSAPTVHKFCDSNPCAGGATCLEAMETYFCECPENKFGKNCDQTPKVIADLCSKCDIDATCKDGRCVCNEGFNGNGFTCRKSTSAVADISTVSTPHKTDSSCDFCPENGQCLDNICVCPPGFENVKRSCVAIDVPRVSNKVLAKIMPPGVELVGSTRNRLPVGQWKENSVVTEYQSVGCWADTKEWRNAIMRAIHSMEGLHPSLNDDYKRRSNPITKCAKAAKAYGYKVFALQNGGQCFTDPNASKTYTTYGPSTACRFGVGGALANDVYSLP